MDFEACSTDTIDSIITVRENKSKFEVYNRSKKNIRKVQVDGCLISDDKEKCDWIIEVDSDKKMALFVELKGCNLDKAISQLSSTLHDTRKKYFDYERSCYAVTTRIPKHNSDVRKRSIEFYKRNKVTLQVKNVVFSLEV